MQLPKLNGLPVNLLAAVFNKTSATYKYYWLLSILQSVEEGNLKISKRNLYSRMISNAWFTVNYFHVSFGKQDLIQQAILAINEIEKIQIDEKQKLVFQKLSTSSNAKTERQLWHFNRNVPHRFLRPWFPKTKNETDSQQEKRIYLQSKTFSEKCLYALYDDSIVINPEWKNYLTDNARVLKDFCYWNLALFLQSFLIVARFVELYLKSVLRVLQTDQLMSCLVAQKIHISHKQLSRLHIRRQSLRSKLHFP
jgi:hypothetical protein